MIWISVISALVLTGTLLFLAYEGRKANLEVDARQQKYKDFMLMLHNGHGKVTPESYKRAMAFFNRHPDLQDDIQIVKAIERACTKANIDMRLNK